MTLKSKLLGAVAGVAMVSGGQAAAAGHSEITVAYFLEWPMPFQFAKVRLARTKKLWAQKSTGSALTLVLRCPLLWRLATFTSLYPKASLLS